MEALSGFEEAPDSFSLVCEPCRLSYAHNGFLSPNQACPQCFKLLPEAGKGPSVDEKLKEYECSSCHESFESIHLLQKHEFLHVSEEVPEPVTDRRPHGKSPRPFPCTLCPKKFTRPADVKRHLLTHTGARPFACEVCGLAFADASNLKKHTATHSKGANEARSYQCSFCPKLFSRPSELKRHFFTHTNTRPYACHLCGLAFTDSSNLKKHKNTHSKQSEHRCPHCDKKFDSLSELEGHLVDHNPLPSVSGAVVGTEGSLTLIPAFRCDVCSKTFAQEIFLQRHIRTHTEARPFACDVCMRCFKSLSHLKNHLLTHGGEKSHVCRVCSKSFLKKSSLRRHESIHLKEKAALYPTYE